MPPTFHINNFKSWARPYRKPFSPYKPPNPYTPRTRKSPRPKPYHDSLLSTLPLPKHYLSAWPPAEVCVHISANTQPCTPSSSRSQPLKISVPEQNTYPETPEHGTTSPYDSAPHFLDPDPIPRCDIQDDTDILIEPPAFQRDPAENALSSPSISRSDDNLEEFFRRPDAQDDIPIDPGNPCQPLALGGMQPPAICPTSRQLHQFRDDLFIS